MEERRKIPIAVKERENIDKNSKTAKLVQHTRLIVWDECPMIARESFEVELRDICDSNEAFGGHLTICSVKVGGE